MSRDDAEAAGSLERGFEVRDVNVRKVLLLAGGLIAFLLLSMAAMGYLYHLSLKKRPQLALGSGNPLYQEAAPPIPSISDSWQDLDRETQQHLGGYRWNDDEKSSVQIPIEQAMDILSKQAPKP